MVKEPLSSLAQKLATKGIFLKCIVKSTPFLQESKLGLKSSIPQFRSHGKTPACLGYEGGDHGPVSPSLCSPTKANTRALNSMDLNREMNN